MSEYIDYGCASVKVAYDRLYDYITSSATTEDVEDSDNVDVSKYTEDESSYRVFGHNSTFASIGLFFDNPTHIIDNLYIGSAFNAASYCTLKKYDIGVVINMTKEISQYYSDEFIYLQYEMYDDNKDGILNVVDEVYQNIINHQNLQSGNILIHCFMGASRSASVVLYYLMKKGMTFDEALTFVKNKRLINPTHRFTKDLLYLEDKEKNIQ